ncbi:MAG: sulfotransferase [Clostridiales bacterium]|nr:sulfotransferase [Clostridiales bacterium]
MKYPNLFIAGAAKCGTTSLYNYLKEHPQIFGPELKEPRFLAIEYMNMDNKGMRMKTAIKDEKSYIKLYEKGDGFKYRMDGTPAYMKYRGAAEKIKKISDDSKVIISIRNPVDRLISLYKMYWNKGYIETNFRDYFYKRKNRELSNGGASFYYNGIKNMYDSLGRDRVHVMVFEEWTKNTLKALSDVHEFLGLEHIPPSNSDKTYYSNRQMIKNRTIRHIQSGRIAKFIYPLLSKKMINYGKRMLGAKKKYINSVVADELKTEILNHYMNDIEKTEDLTGLDLSSWKSIY